ncbi:MAG: hypothetical protein ACI835_004107 [Planctomycetota bacterium]|jgi:hypothetical protein
MLRSCLDQLRLISKPSAFLAVAMLLGESDSVLAQCDLTPLGFLASGQGQRFGQSMVLEEQRAFVGVPGFAGGSGAVVLYERVGRDWIETQTIVGSVSGANFGTAIAVEGDRLLVGAPDEGSTPHGVGAVYLFQLGPAGGVIQRFEGDSAQTDSFGAAVSMDGARILIGAPAEHDAGFLAGAAYLFEEQAGLWSQQVKFTGMPMFGYEAFGASLSIRGDLAVISQPIELGSGTIFVFQRGPAGWTNTPVQSMSSPCPGIEFGTPLLFDGHQLIAASPDGLSGGCINIMHWDGSSFVLDDIIDPPGSGSGFGKSIALHEDRLLVGANGSPAGRAHMFLNRPTGWERTHIFHPTRTGPAVAFGWTVALSAQEGWISDLYYEPFATGRVDRFQLARGVRHCAALPNSTGLEASIEATGCASIGDNDLVLTAALLPDQPGLFAYSLDRTQLPFGNGFRCLAGTVYRLPVTTAAGGLLRTELDVTSPPAGSGQITASTTWHFQAWYRDPLGGGSGWNASDAIAVTFGQ